MAEWERSAIVTVWFRVRTLPVSHIGVEILHFRVAWASDLFGSSERYMCNCHWPAKSPISASLSLLCIKLFKFWSLSSVLLTANIERSWSQTRRRTTQRSVTWVMVFVYLHSHNQSHSETQSLGHWPVSWSQLGSLGAGYSCWVTGSLGGMMQFLQHTPTISFFCYNRYFTQESPYYYNGDGRVRKNSLFDCIINVEFFFY